MRAPVPFLHPLVDRGRNPALPAPAAVAPAAAAPAPAERDGAEEPEQDEQDEQEPEETEQTETDEVRPVIVIRSRRCRSSRDLRSHAGRPARLVSDDADDREQDARQRHPQKTETASHCRYSFVTRDLMPFILRWTCEGRVKGFGARDGGFRSPPLRVPPALQNVATARAAHRRPMSISAGRCGVRP